VYSLFFQQQQKNCQQNPNRSVISRPTDEDHDLIQKITSNLLDSIQNRKFHYFSPFFFCFLLYHSLLQSGRKTNAETD
jgi:hypothetical protein